MLRNFLLFVLIFANFMISFQFSLGSLNRLPFRFGAQIRKRKVSGSNPTTPVRVRFAPSPTGSLHVGGARTALFNWLLARNTNGTFIVRVEDTDLARSTRESETSILNDLRWLNMNWDEGPDIGGAYGPYRQSERLHIYKKHAEELIEKGLAYRCFCTEEELEKQKLDAARHGLHNVGYLGTWRDADPAEVKKRLDRGDPYAVRFKVPPNKIIMLRDMVRGLVTWSGDASLGDFVIMRSNGVPVYNFCVAVDDYLMNITHVIRAEEHLSNTPKQLLVLEALGCKNPPTYAHCSLILAPDKSKLSKRHGATSVSEFASLGFSPNAMVNYLCNLGWNSGLKQEIFQPNELVSLFNLSRIVPSAAVFDLRKLKWVNAQHLQGLPQNEYVGILLDHLTGDSKNFTLLNKDKAWFTTQHESDQENQKVQMFIKALLAVLRNDLHIPSEVRKLLTEYVEYPIVETITGGDTRPLEVVEDHYKHFHAVAKILLRDYNLGVCFVGDGSNPADGWKIYVEKVQDEVGKLVGAPVTSGVIMMALRVLLTGRSKGPNVGELLNFLFHAENYVKESSSVKVIPLNERVKVIEGIVKAIDKISESN